MVTVLVTVVVTVVTVVTASESSPLPARCWRSFMDATKPRACSSRSRVAASSPRWLATSSSSRVAANSTTVGSSCTPWSNGVAPVPTQIAVAAAAPTNPASQGLSWRLRFASRAATREATLPAGDCPASSCGAGGSGRSISALSSRRAAARGSAPPEGSSPRDSASINASLDANSSMPGSVDPLRGVIAPPAVLPVVCAVWPAHGVGPRGPHQGYCPPLPLSPPQTGPQTPAEPRCRGPSH